MSRASLLVLVSVRMVATEAALLLVGLVLACGDAEEEIAPGTPSPTSVASPSATPTPTEAPTVFETPSPSPAQVPADWRTYADPGGLFTIRYPPNWLEIAGDLYSSDPRKADMPGYGLPPEMIKVEVTYFEAAGSDTCGGIISTDVNSGENLGLLSGATATTLGGVAGGELIRVEGDPAISEEHLIRIHAISVIHLGYCLNLAAYYTQQSPDIDIFLEIVSTFEFKPQSG